MKCLLQLMGVITDLSYRVEAVPAAGSEAIVHGARLSAGGGFNAMLAARRSGMQVIYGGMLGTGPLAQVVRQALDDAGIELALLSESVLDQGCCTVLVDARGERTFIAATGAESELGSCVLPGSVLAKADWVLVSGYSLVFPGSRQGIVSQVMSLPPEPMMLFDPGPLVGQIPDDLLATVLHRADWLSCNADEALYLTGSDQPPQAAAALARERPHRGGAIVRTGAGGCTVARAGEVAVPVSGFAVATVDTNGAGDAHVGGFIAHLAARGDVLAACRHANAVAALSTTRQGPATSPSAMAVQALLEAQAVG